jgi:uncharacterized protein
VLSGLKELPHLLPNVVLREIVLRSFAALLAISASTACAAPQRPDTQYGVDERPAGRESANSAETYLQAAMVAPSSERDILLLRSAEASLKADDRARAAQTLQEVEAAQLTPVQRQHYELMQASLGQLPGSAEDVLQAFPPPMAGSDPFTAERILSARAHAYLQLGDISGAVHALVQRETWLDNNAARIRNQSRIWGMLQSAPALDSEFQANPELDEITRGWLELAQLQRTGTSTRTQLLNAWEARYGSHPAADTVLELVRGESVTGITTIPIQASTADLSLMPSLETSPLVVGQVGTLALILPLSGPLSGAARAVRDGFMTAWFEQPLPRPRVLVLDSGSGADTALAVYERALSAGADMVIGPLSKEAVATLARMITPGHPLLALNYLETGQAPPPNFFQFGLAPEDEAQQVAERALSDGHRRAVALIPEGDWGRRTLAAFRERFESQGGRLLDVEFYASGLSDFSVPVQRLLKFEASSQRKRSLDAVLGDTVEFSSSPGNLPDFVFMAAQPQQARLIRPQFRFQGAGQIPLYATSLVYEGTLSPGRDADLDDIRFCDMPFLLGSGDNASQRERMRSLWPDSFARHTRLYAFGYDAAKLALRLSAGGERNLAGATGQLRVAEDGRVHRKLLWARFMGGKPQPLGDHRPYP